MGRCAKYLSEIRYVMINYMKIHLAKFAELSDKPWADESYVNFCSAYMDQSSSCINYLHEIEVNFNKMKNLYINAINKMMYSGQTSVIAKLAKTSQYLSCEMNLQIFVIKAAFIDYDYIGQHMNDLFQALDKVRNIDEDDVTSRHDSISKFYHKLSILSKPIDDNITTSLGKFIGRITDKGHVIVN